MDLFNWFNTWKTKYLKLQTYTKKMRKATEASKQTFESYFWLQEFARLENYG